MENPFSDFKTNEMSIERIEEFFTKPKFIDKIYTPNAMFITGQRGSGKTMFMRYIENNPIIFDGTVKYVGVYARFDRLIYGSSGNSSMNTELFLHHLIITLTQQLVNRLSSLLDGGRMKFRNFPEFSRAVCATFYDNDTICDSFQALWEYLEKQRLSTMKYIRNPRRVEMPLICDYSNCFVRITEQLHTEPLLSDLTLLFLLDEYENLSAEYRKAVNGLIKAAAYGYTFKVFHRPIALDTQVLDSEEHLMEQHDIMAKDFYKEIIGGDKFYPEFMAQMVGKRLQLYYKAHKISYQAPDDLDIRNYLETVTANQEFKKFPQKRNCVSKIKQSIQETAHNDSQITMLIEELSDDIFKLRLLQSILEKKLGKPSFRGDKQDILTQIINAFRNNTKTYQNWAENYRYSILYLLCFETQSRKFIAGWDQILKISSGIARHAINILYYTFEKSLLTNRKSEKFPCFSADDQTDAALTVAEKLYEDIIRVPVIGKQERSLIQYYGQIFQLCHRDSTIKKWEVNHFVISKQDKIKISEEQSIQLDRVLDGAITWGHILKRKVTKEKRREELSSDLSEYQLHPLLCVYFGISWRKKQRYDTTYEELYASAYDEDQRKANIRKTAWKILGGSYEKEFSDQYTVQLPLPLYNWGYEDVD